MIRTGAILLLFILWGTGVESSTLSLSIAPDNVRLGEPVHVSCPLPPGSWQLPGLPGFGGLALLEAPRISDGKLELDLLPVRPGPAELPELTLTDGARAIRTPRISLDVADPVPADAKPEGRLRHGAPPRSHHLLAAGAALLLAFGILTAALFRSRGRNLPFPVAERRQLARLPESAEREILAQELDIWLYSPYRPEPAERADWWRRARALEGKR